MLLDTHVLIWLIAGDERFGAAARARVEEARRAEALLISPISFFEAATLVRRERVDLGIEWERWVEAILAIRGIAVAPVDIPTAGTAGLLPDWIHGDPADRILIATAHRRGIPLVTADRLILKQAQAGHLDAIDARH